MSRVQSPDHIKIQSAINRIIDWLEDREVSIPASIDRIQKSTPIDDAIETGNKLFHIYQEYIKKHNPKRPTTVNKSINTYLNISIKREDEKSNNLNGLSGRLGRVNLTNINENGNRTLKRYGKHGPFVGNPPRIGGYRRYNNNVNNIIKGYSLLNGYRGTNRMKFPRNNVTKRGSYKPPSFSPIVENPKWRKPVNMSNYNLAREINALPNNRYTRPYRAPTTMRNLLNQRRRERDSRGTLRRASSAWFGGKQKGTRKRRL